MPETEPTPTLQGRGNHPHTETAQRALAALRVGELRRESAGARPGSRAPASHVIDRSRELERTYDIDSSRGLVFQARTPRIVRGQADGKAVCPRKGATDATLTDPPGWAAWEALPRVARHSEPRQGAAAAVRQLRNGDGVQDALVSPGSGACPRRVSSMRRDLQKETALRAIARPCCLVPCRLRLTLCFRSPNRWTVPVLWAPLALCSLLPILRDCSQLWLCAICFFIGRSLWCVRSWPCFPCVGWVAAELYIGSLLMASHQPPPLRWLVEYCLHRFLFHASPSSYWGITLHYSFHGCHHKYPNDRLRLVRSRGRFCSSQASAVRGTTRRLRISAAR